MAENDIVKPVENLQNIGSVMPSGRREERKRRQNQQQKNKDNNNDYQETNQTFETNGKSNPAGSQNSASASIDYCA